MSVDGMLWFVLLDVGDFAPTEVGNFFVSALPAGFLFTRLARLPLEERVPTLLVHDSAFLGSRLVLWAVSAKS